MSDLSKTDSPEVPPRIPSRYVRAKRAIIRIHNPGTEQYQQEYGTIYLLDPQDKSTLALYGGHQVIVLDREIKNFECWTIVSLVEIWS